MRPGLAALALVLAGPAMAQDADGDRYCPPLDCDDTDPMVHGGASEIPGDGIDQDCNGSDLVGCYEDLDGDGRGSTTVVAAPGDPDCSQAGHAANGNDCDDTVPNPTGADVCDGVDDNCDGFGGPDTDEDLDGICWRQEQVIGTDGCLIDTDSDTSPDGEDCAPGNVAIHPYATEICDLIDNDCDGLVDAADPDVASCPSTTGTGTGSGSGTGTGSGTGSGSGTGTGTGSGTGSGSGTGTTTGTPPDSGAGSAADKDCACQATSAVGAWWWIPAVLVGFLRRRGHLFSGPASVG